MLNFHLRAMRPELHPVIPDVRLNLQKKAGCRPNQANSAAAVGMQPIARPLLEIPMLDPDCSPSRLGRFLCRFGIHLWSIWRVTSYYSGGRPANQYRRCLRCGKTQTEWCS